MASTLQLWPSHLSDGTAAMIFASAAGADQEIDVQVFREGFVGGLKKAPHAAACPCLLPARDVSQLELTVLSPLNASILRTTIPRGIAHDATAALLDRQGD